MAAGFKELRCLTKGAVDYLLPVVWTVCFVIHKKNIILIDAI